jgi:hypothetical protein
MMLKKEKENPKKKKKKAKINEKIEKCKNKKKTKHLPTNPSTRTNHHKQANYGSPAGH